MSLEMFYTYIWYQKCGCTPQSRVFNRTVNTVTVFAVTVKFSENFEVEAVK